MLFIGLTGGIGSGKSEALAAAERFGAAVLSSDAVVHELLQTDDVRDLLSARFGDRVLDPSGTLDRGAIAEIVFADRAQLAWLETTLFPLVGRRMAAWKAEVERQGDRSVAVVEVPLLFEAEMEAAFDATIAVVANEEIRSQRAGGRDHRGMEGRGARQLSQDEKACRADHVIRNDGSLTDLDSAVSALLEQLSGDQPR